MAPTTETTLSLSMAAGRLNDQALNQNNASNTLTFNFDSTPPVPTGDQKGHKRVPRGAKRATKGTKKAPRMAKGDQGVQGNEN